MEIETIESLNEEKIVNLQDFNTKNNAQIQIKFSTL